VAVEVIIAVLSRVLILKDCNAARATQLHGTNGILLQY
jgi:hypothetical protein